MTLRSRRCTKPRFSSVWTILLPIFTVPTAIAQSETEVPKPSSKGTIEVIEVTARRSVESLQATPISLTALDTEAIEQKGIRSVVDLTGYVPTLQIQANASGSNDVTLSMRGLRVSDSVSTAESPIGVYLDGAILPRISGAMMDLLELERVEVLRGPQGSLYGRNSTGGAINMISKKPYLDFGLTQDFTVGSESLFITQTRIDSGELGESGLTAAFSFRSANRDGHIDIIDTPNDRDGGAYDDRAYRLAINWLANDYFEVDYSYNRIESEGTKTPSHLAAVSYEAGEVAQVNGEPLELQTSRADSLNLNNNGYGTSDTTLHTLAINWDMSNNYSLRAVTGIRDWQGEEFGNDLDGNGLLQANVINPVTFETSIQAFPGLFYSPLNKRKQQHFSQELQLLGTITDDLDFVFGLFYFDEDFDEYNPTNFYLPRAVIGPMFGNPNADFGMLAANIMDFNGSSKSKAAFSQFNWRLNQDLRLTAGIRYTQDEKYLYQTVVDFNDPSGFVSGGDSRDYSNFNWNISADYQFSETSFGYARVATGYKSGGLTARSAGTGNLFLDDFDEETLIGYEVGIKNDLFDKRLRLNTNVFYTQYDDFQIDSFLFGSGGATSLIENAGDADQLGVEVEFVIAATEDLRIDGNIAWLDMDFQKYEVLNRKTNQLVDVAEEAEFPYVSEITAALGVQYLLAELWGGELSLRADARYIGKRVFTQVEVVPGPTPDLDDYHSPFMHDIAADAYTLVDLRASLDGVDTGFGELRLSAWMRNTLDEEYITQGIDFGSLGIGNVIYGDPRTIGLDMRLQF